MAKYTIIAIVVTFMIFFPPNTVTSETLGDLVERKGLYYKKYSNVPFTGKFAGFLRGSFKDGKREGYWVRYWDNGQLAYKGNFKDGLEEGTWVGYWNNGQLSYKGNYKNGNREGDWMDYNKDGTINQKYSGTFKKGMKISE